MYFEYTFNKNEFKINASIDSVTVSFEEMYSILNANLKHSIQNKYQSVFIITLSKLNLKQWTSLKLEKHIFHWSIKNILLK